MASPITIDWKNFIAGESQSDFLPDKGFSTLSSNLNLTRSRGKLHFSPSSTDRGGSTLTGNIVASANDVNNLGNDKYFIDDEGAVYTLNGSTFTKRQTIDEAAGGDFVLGTTDMLQFKLNTYITSDDTIHELTGSDLATTENWWSGLDGTKRHPLEQIEDEMFIGDGNTIFFWNGTSSGTAFTLPTEQNVTSLRKHPDGRTLLAFTGKTIDFSHTRPSAGRVYYCDPTLRDWTREVDLEAQVEGSRVTGGVVYVTWGTNFGFFDGSGLQFIRKFETSTTTYSHNISNWEDILLVRDGRHILAYGDLGAGKVWWKMLRNPGAEEINNISYKGDNVILMAFADNSAGDLIEFDMDNAGANDSFYANRMNFGQEVEIKRIEIIHDESDSAGDTNFDVISVRPDAAGTLDTIEEIRYTNTSITKTTINTDIKTDNFQPRIRLLSDDIGFRIIRIFYDPIGE